MNLLDADVLMHVLNASMFVQILHAAICMHIINADLFIHISWLGGNYGGI